MQKTTHVFPIIGGRKVEQLEGNIEAAQRVQRANAKLVAFERGFISEDGIKEREWYKHLGVAPGKWLGTCPSYLSCAVRGAPVVHGGLRRVARHPPVGAMDDGAPCSW